MPLRRLDYLLLNGAQHGLQQFLTSYLSYWYLLTQVPRLLAFHLNSTAILGDGDISGYLVAEFFCLSIGKTNHISGSVIVTLIIAIAGQRYSPPFNFRAI